MKIRKHPPRGARKYGPRTPDGTRRKDKTEFAPQWLRRYRDRYA